MHYCVIMVNVYYWWIMDNCPICNRHILRHAKMTYCWICQSKFHIKCITLNHETQISIMTNNSEWYCQNCICEIFPFNHIENDKSFLAEINNFTLSDRIAALSDMLFQPFELNTNDYYSPLFDVDPDINFYNKIDFHTGFNCNYYMEDFFSGALRERIDCNNADELFSLCHVNIRSIPANLGNLEAYLQCLDFEFSIVGISETWLQENNCDLYNLNGYNLVENHRTTKKGGGVGIFIKKHIPYVTRNDLVSTDSIFESIFIELDKQVFHQKSNIILGIIYRPPNTDINSFNEALGTILDKLKVEDKTCYLMGDFNINLLNYTNHALTSDFVDLMHSYSFISLINRPTRITNNSATLIDNIFANKPNLNSFQGILVTDISDHLPIIYIDCKIPSLSNDDFIHRRNLSPRNKQAFRNAIANLNWDEIYQETDMQLAFSMFYSKFLHHYNTHFPKKKLN